MSLRGRWTVWRNRRLASPAFQAWAAAFPLTRPRARREAAELFDLVAGFVHSQVLAACLELGWLERLARAPAAATALAADAAVPVAAAERLLRAAAALGLTEPLDGGWTLGPRGAALLGNPGIGAMVAHHSALYADLADPVALLRRGGGGGALADYWAYARAGEPAAAADAAVSAYSQLMSASQPMIAAEAIGAGVLRGRKRLLDVGGGEGRFVEAVAAAVPGLELALFDLPAVAARAGRRLAASGAGGIATYGGDFVRDDLPHGFDTISLVRILHDHDDDRALALLRNIRRALAPGAALLIIEPMADRRVARMSDSYFGLYLFAMGSGRVRSPAEIARMLRSAGFASVGRRPTRLTLVTSIVIAET